MSIFQLLQGPQAFQVTADDPAAKDSVRSGILHGTLDEHRRLLHALNKRGGAIFYTVNETDGEGRSKEHITRIRAYMIDCDGLPTTRAKRENIAELRDGPLAPSAIVESKNGLHVYWLSSGDEPVDPIAYRNVNRRLAHAYGGDPAAVDIARAMRAPGFLHMKNPQEPFRITIVSEAPEVRYTPEQILAAYPPSPKEVTPPRPAPQPAALPETARDANVRTRYLSTAVANQVGDVQAAQEGTRHSTLNRSAFILGQLAHLGGVPHDEIIRALCDAGLATGLDQSEVDTTVRDGFTAGLEQPRTIDWRTDSAASEGADTVRPQAEPSF